MTSYDIIFKPFLEKINKDTDFFFYEGLNENQTKAIINRRYNGFLDKSVLEFKSKVKKAEIDFNDRNSILQSFNFDLVDDEIDILIDLMLVEYFSEDISKLKIVSVYFTESEISKIYSPANERKTYVEMVKQMKEDVELKIKRYNGKDRKTGKFKLPTYDLIKIGDNYAN